MRRCIKHLLTPLRIYFSNITPLQIPISAWAISRLGNANICILMFLALRPVRFALPLYSSKQNRKSERGKELYKKERELAEASIQGAHTKISRRKFGQRLQNPKNAEIGPKSQKRQGAPLG